MDPSIKAIVFFIKMITIFWNYNIELLRLPFLTSKENPIYLIEK
jgi:hypothetical protein